MTTATTTPITATGGLRPRRSCLAVPGSSPRFLEKAQGLPADQVFLDLEDACAPLVKESARHMIVDALNNGDWSGKIRVVRVNDWTTHWTYRDVITVVEGAGANLDCLMLPKVQDAGQVKALDLLLTQIEKTVGLEVGRIGIEAQIENARGLMNVEAIAAANEIFSPSQEDYDHAELILDAYDWCTSEAGGAKGSAMLGDEMIDEASAKMALVIAGKGRAAGMQRTSKFEPPEA